MEQIEEFLYQAFCAAVFCLALSLFFQMTERYSDLLEGGRGLLEGDLTLSSGEEAGQEETVTGSELMLILHDVLQEDIEIDGILLQKGGIYKPDGLVGAQKQYRKTVIYEEGRVGRIVYSYSVST